MRLQGLKWAVDELWEHERHCLQTAACQCLLDEHATHERQESAHQEAARAAQWLLYKRATHKRQEASRQEAAHASKPS
jgi:hypothetical protein